MDEPPRFHALADGSRRAYDQIPGSPGVVFLHGLMSDRGGTKAQALETHCRAKGYGLLRFDMFGHGQSSGRFEDGTISRWTQDAVALIDALTQGPQVLIGSSMGGWVMLRTALARPHRIKACIGIAAAPDFTTEMRAALSPDQQATLRATGLVQIQSDYDTRPYPISAGLLDDGDANMVLGGPIPIGCPVRLLHGQQDTGVPWQKSLALAERITGGDVDVLLIKDGDHRLSRPQDLAKLCGVLDDVVNI